MKQTKILSVILALFAAVSLASCGKSSSNGRFINNDSRYCFATPVLDSDSNPKKDASGNFAGNPIEKSYTIPSEQIFLTILIPYDTKSKSLITDADASHLSFEISDEKIVAGTVEELSAELEGTQAIWLTAGPVNGEKWHSGTATVTLSYDDGRDISFTQTLTLVRPSSTE